MAAPNRLDVWRDCALAVVQRAHRLKAQALAVPLLCAVTMAAESGGGEGYCHRALHREPNSPGLGHDPHPQGSLFGSTF